MQRRYFLAAAGFLIAFSSAVAAPKLDALFPAGGQRGTSSSVQVLGKYSSWPVEVWCESAEVAFTASDKKGVFDVSISTNASPGAFLVRLFDASGASQGRPFVVGMLPEISESGGNDNQAGAQAVEQLPVTIHGRLERRGDSDFFRFPLKKGQRLAARLDAYGLGSPVDPFLQLFGPSGNEVALESDGFNPDPRLIYEAPEDGDYVIHVFGIDHKPSVNVTFSGGSSTVYRLMLTTGPWATHARTLAVKPGAGDAVELAGWDAAGNEAVFPAATDGSETVGDRVLLWSEQAPNAVPAAVVEGGILLEDAARERMPLRPPFSISGLLDQPGVTDAFRFSVKKDEQWNLRVQARALRLPVDPVLELKKPDGGLIRRVDDSNKQPDAEYLYKFPADGDYSVEISDLFRRGGSAFRYRFAVEKPEPDFAATTTQDRIVLKAGESEEISLKLERTHGHGVKLSVTAEGLPAGVTVKSGEIPGKSGTFKVTLTAKPDAPVHNGPVRIELRQEAESEAPPRARFVSYSYQTPDSDGEYLIDHTPWLWLTVTAAAKKNPGK